MNQNNILLTVVSDVICPWCYIGKRRFDAALEYLEKDSGVESPLQTEWRPYELNPTMPREGISRDEYGVTKFGSETRATKFYKAIQTSALAEGIEMNVDKIQKTPNTKAAHALIEIAKQGGCQSQVLDALFQAYFLEGKDIGSIDVLEKIAGDFGLALPVTDRTKRLTSLDAFITAESKKSADEGVHGVPSFFYNNKFLFSGAQSTETIVLSVKKAIRRGL
jgi:predicted DsbA family dithiol-disulfide isomerase